LTTGDDTDIATFPSWVSVLEMSSIVQARGGGGERDDRGVAVNNMKRKRDDHNHSGATMAPCAPFLAGKCQKGDTCSFSHNRAFIFRGSGRRGQASAANTAAANAVEGMTEHRFMLGGQDKRSVVGKAVGKGGSTIASIRNKTGTWITIDSTTAEVTITGNAVAVEEAASLVQQAVKGVERRFVLSGQNKRKVIGKAIGKNGATLASIKKKTGTWITIDSTTAEVTIIGFGVGAAAAMEEAITLVKQAAAKSAEPVYFDPSEEEEEEEEDTYESMYGFDGGHCGFSAGDCDELMMQGVKPWDDDAADVLRALSGVW